MVVNASELENNFNKFLQIAKKEDVIITKNGKEVARLVAPNKKTLMLDSLVGIIPNNIDESTAKSEYLAEKYGV